MISFIDANEQPNGAARRARLPEWIGAAMAAELLGLGRNAIWEMCRGQKVFVRGVDWRRRGEYGNFQIRSASVLRVQAQRAGGSWIDMAAAGRILGISEEHACKLCRERRFAETDIAFVGKTVVRLSAVIQRKTERESGEWLGTVEAASILGVTPSCLIRKLKAGLFPMEHVQRYGGRGPWFLSRSAVLDYQRKRNGARVSFWRKGGVHA